MADHGWPVNSDAKFTLILPENQLWSGGGSVLNRNLVGLSNTRPSVLSVAEQYRGGIQLVTANRSPRGRNEIVWMPQNAWPWHYPRARPDELHRIVGLRVASRASAYRAIAMIRIGPMIPASAIMPSSKEHTVVHNVLDEAFEDLFRNVLENSIQSSKSERYFCMVGTIWSYRNVELLLRGYIEYRARGGSIGLRVLGPISSASYSKKLAALADAAEAKLFPTRLERVEAITQMVGAAAVVFPSSVEASPVSVLEADSLGVHSILSRIPAHEDIVVKRSVRSCSYFSSASELASCFERAERSDLSVRPRTAGERSATRAEWEEDVTQRLEAIA